MSILDTSSKNFDVNNDIKENNEMQEKPVFTKEEVISLSKFQREELKYSLDNEGKISSFLKNYPKFSENPDYLAVIEFCLEKELKREIIALILDANWELLKERSDSEEIFDIVKELKEEWLLDSAGIIYEEDEIKEEDSYDNKSVSEKKESRDEIAEKLIKIASSQVWIREGAEANKYGWFNTYKTPWCAAFINWVLMKAWYPWTKSLAAKSFIKESWFWHVAIKVWDKMVWWNQWNKVSVANISRTISWYAIPTENWLEIKKWNFNKKDIPDGAIIVMGRNPKSRKFR